MVAERLPPAKTLLKLQEILNREMRRADPGGWLKADTVVWERFENSVASQLTTLRNYVAMLGKPDRRWHAHLIDDLTIRIAASTLSGRFVVGEILIRAGWATVPEMSLKDQFEMTHRFRILKDRKIVPEE